MLAQLTLKELREFYLKEILSTDDEESDDDDGSKEDEVALDYWRTFTDNNNKLEVLCMSKCKMSVEQFQIALETLPLLKSLEFTIYGFAPWESK
jgi:hypothetical protein